MMNDSGQKNSNKLDQVLETALSIFSRYGFKKTTMEDIAKELGMTQPNLYFYIKNKKDLYERAILHEMGKMFKHMREAANREKNVAQKIVSMSEAGFEYVSKHPNLQQLLINDSDLLIKTRERIDESTHKTDLTESMNQVGSTLLSEILKEGIKDGWFRDFNVEVISTLLGKIYSMFVNRLFVMPDILPRQEMTKEIVNLVLYGLVNPKKIDQLNVKYSGYKEDS